MVVGCRAAVTPPKKTNYYFLGLTYIIVYCGAIAILFLFVIMMVTYGLYGGALY
jgi:NADH:ubiquinone oxidoreductase subunit 6 (subunit J)